MRAEGNGPQPGTPEARRRRRRQQPQQRELSLEDLNPISLGRETRKVFDDVWQQLQRIGNPAASRQILDDAYRCVVAGDGLRVLLLPQLAGLIQTHMCRCCCRLAPAGDFESPQAANTTVLVVGAAGRVGKVLVRKLLLRGYKVKALVRHRSGEVLEDIPQSVEQVAGDLGDYQSCRRAVEGVDKVGGWAGGQEPAVDSFWDISLTPSAPSCGGAHAWHQHASPAARCCGSASTSQLTASTTLCWPAAVRR